MAKKGQVFKKVPLEKKLYILKLHLKRGRSADTLAKEFEMTLYTNRT
jgi:hypothetical protein